MSAAAILAAGTATTAALGSVTLAVAAIASPINRARDARRQAGTEARVDRETAGLAAQIRDGADTAALVDPDPGKLAAAAYSAAAGLAAWLATEDVPFMQRVLDELAPILAAEQVPVPVASTAPLLTAAAALQLLLHRLREAYDGPRQVRVSIAAGAAAEVLRVLPGGRAVDFNPLTEHDPAPLRCAQAVWIDAAREAGLSGWTRALPAGGVA